MIPGVPGKLLSFLSSPFPASVKICPADIGYPGASNSGFQGISDYSDNTLNALDLHTSFYQYPPSVTPISSSSDSLNLDFPSFGVSTDPVSFEFDSPNPQIPIVQTPEQQPSAFDNEYVLYYFEHVRREHMFFAGTTFTNAIYSVRPVIQKHRISCSPFANPR
jgi:hypothetical protein